MSTIAASIAPKLFKLETSVRGFVWGMPSISGRVMLMGAIVCLMTKSTILISALLFVYGPKSKIIVSLCVTITICRVLHTIDCLLRGSTVGS